MSVIGVKYGAYDMQTGGCRVHDTDVFSAPPNSIQADQLPEADGAVVVKQQYTAKAFTVNGKLQADSVADLKALMDSFKQAMAVKNQAFDVDEDGEVRRYLANAENIILTRNGPTIAAFSVQMQSPDGMGWDVDSRSLLASSGITTSTVQLPITTAGTYRAEPLIQATIGSLTGSTTNTVTISNGVTLRSISVTRSWTAGDLLEIDCLNKTVFVNNSPVEFNGQFLRFDIGAGSIGWLDDFSSRNVTISATYTRRWL